jgi:general secretion pathway protein H
MKPCALRPQRGLTLIETLAVLLVASLLVGLVGVKLAGNEVDAVRVEAERLAGLLDHASAEARLTGRRIAWAGEPGGYRFFRATDTDQWAELAPEGVMRPRSLPEGVRIEVAQDAGAWPRQVGRLQFAADGPGDPAEIRLVGAGRSIAITVLPVGMPRISDPAR